MIGREELFALAEQPIGSAETYAAAEIAFQRQAKAPPEAVAASKRARKIWTPAGTLSANTNAQREHERSLKALNFDLEDAVEAAGGQRGTLRR